MKKTVPIHPVPERKNNFNNWVNKIQSPDTEEIDKLFFSVQKDINTRKSGNKYLENSKNWDKIQIKSNDVLMEKIKLMEEIRQSKIEKEHVTWIYTPILETLKI